MARRSILRRDSSTFSLSGTGETSEPSVVSLGSTVSFGSVQVRNYERVLADAPEVGSCYTSFAIGWAYDEEQDMSVDDFECSISKIAVDDDKDVAGPLPGPSSVATPGTATTSSSSSKNQLRALSPMERFNVLGSYGFSHDELRESAQNRARLSEKSIKQKKKPNGLLSRLRRKRR